MKIILEYIKILLRINGVCKYCGKKHKELYICKCPHPYKPTGRKILIEYAGKPLVYDEIKCSLCEMVSIQNERSLWKACQEIEK